MTPYTSCRCYDLENGKLTEWFARNARSCISCHFSQKKLSNCPKKLQSFERPGSWPRCFLIKWWLFVRLCFQFRHWYTAWVTWWVCSWALPKITLERKCQNLSNIYTTDFEETLTICWSEFGTTWMMISASTKNIQIIGTCMSGFEILTGSPYRFIRVG